MMVLTGANSLLVWRDDANTKLRPVGVGVKVGTFEPNYQMEKIYGVGDRTMDTAYSKGFAGSLSFDAILGDAENKFLTALITSGMIDDAQIPEMYVFITDNAVPITSSSGGFDDGSKVNVYKIAGWKADSIKITFRGGEFVGISFDGKFAKLEVSDITWDSVNGQWTYNSTAYSFDYGDMFVEPLTFANASLSATSGGSPLSEIDVDMIKEFEIDLKHNLEALYTLNSMFPKKFVEQKLDVDVSMTMYFVDKSKYDAILSKLVVNHSDTINANFNSANPYPNATLTITVGGASHTHTFTIDNAVLMSYSNSFEEANVIEGSLKFAGKTISYSFS